jgi:hypothetical protein
VDSTAIASRERDEKEPTATTAQVSDWTTMTSSQPTEQLSETYIQDSFHSYLKSSLTQAKLERLLGEDVLSSAEGDLMITGEPRKLSSHGPD